MKNRRTHFNSPGLRFAQAINAPICYEMFGSETM